MIEYKLLIDLQSERSMHTDICLTSGDVRAYRLMFSFISGGNPYNVSEFLLNIKAKRPDGVVVIDKGVITPEGLAFYDVKSNMYAVHGNLSMEIALTAADGMFITTKELFISVRKGYGNGDISAGNTTPILAKLAEESVKANQAAQRAESATLEIGRFINMDISAESVNGDTAAFVRKTDDGEKVLLHFGIPAGRMPEKGVDYFTEEEKSEMVCDVLAALPNGDEVSY